MDVQRENKAAMLNVIKRQTQIYIRDEKSNLSFRENEHKYASIRTRCFSVYSNNFPKIFWGPHSASQPETYLSYNICTKCGDFVNPKTKARNKHPIMRYPWKRQRCNNEISPFSKVTCKEESYHFTYLL